MSCNMKAPCAQCPWTPSCPPGALGGSPPETYIGQAFGPFILPCHMACNFNDPDWKQKANTTPQCAGAAAFRANIGVRLPGRIHTQPKSDKVFAGPVEFYMHHKQIGRKQAEQQLQAVPPIALLHRQLNRQTNINYGEAECS